MPTFKLMGLSDAEKKKLSLTELEKLQANSINLGLDLKGGMHLVLEVDMSKLTDNEKKDALDRALEVIRNRIDQFGVSEPLIQKQGSNRIIVELPGLQNPERAKKLIGQTALLEFKIVREGQEVQQLLQKIDDIAREKNLLVKYNIISQKELEKEKTQEKDKNVSESDKILSDLQKDVKSSDTSKASDTTVDTSTSVLDKLAKKDTLEVNHPILSRIFPQRSREFVDYYVPKSEYKILDSLFKTQEVQDVIPEDVEILWGSKDVFLGPEAKPYRQLYVVTKKPEMTGTAVKDAIPTIGQGYDPSIAGKPIVEFKVKNDYVETFAQITGSNINKRLAIVLDHKVVNAPKLITKIRNGESIITGSKDMDEAKDLAIVLRSGALPAPVNIIEERTVGPTLGADSIRMGQNAALIGVLLVVLFMLIYYKFAGLIADFALSLNFLFVLAAMAYLNSTLTLPGIAGLILTIGMAVDANVLIFERIREEIDLNKTIAASVESGFTKARWTILDSNITTLLTALVLYNFGTGPIRGFAVTLSIGILSSMFTALVVSRLIFDFIVFKIKPKTLSI